MRDKEFNKGPWKQDNVEADASRVIAGKMACCYVTVLLKSTAGELHFRLVFGNSVRII